MTTSTRNIVTKYYFRREVKKINRSIHPDRAVLNCIYHLQRNDYQASIAEVVNEETGKLYAVVTRNINGKITIRYQSNDLFVDSEEFLATSNEVSDLIRKAKPQ